MDKRVWIIQYRIGNDKSYHWTLIGLAESEEAAKLNLDYHEAKPLNWNERHGYQYARRRANFGNGKRYITYRLNRSGLIREAEERERLENRNQRKAKQGAQP